MNVYAWVAYGIVSHFPLSFLLLSSPSSSFLFFQAEQASGVSHAGHRYATSLAASFVSETAAVAEELGGLTHVRHMHVVLPSLLFSFRYPICQ